MVACAALLLGAVAPRARAQAVFGQTGVGTAAGSTQSVTVSLPAGGSVAGVEVRTLGATGLDFAKASDGCTGQSFGPGGTCTVTVSFTPTAPGLRLGAVVAQGSNSVALGTGYVVGTGVGGLGVMSPGTMLTVAGNGEWTSVNDGGSPTDGNLDLPQGVAFDGAGNMYIADSVHNRIRMVSAGSSPQISTVAGGTEGGYTGDGGPATAAELNVPTSVAVDGAGNIYFADSGNNVVRMIAAETGVITTVAGNGTAGYGGDGGAATGAELNYPVGVTVDGAGDVFIADQKNERIRELVASSGKIETVAGNGDLGGNGHGTYAGDGGAATSAGLGDPWAVAFDATGRMFIPDSANNVIRVVTNGVITTFAGVNSAGAGFAGDGGAATAAQLDSPSGVLVDVAGDLVISDTQNNRVRMVSAKTGNIATIAGNGIGKYAGDGGSALQAGIYGPYGLAMDAYGDLVLADYFDHRIREIPADLVVLTFTPATRVGQKSATQDQTIVNLGNGTLAFAAMSEDQNAAVDASVTTCAGGASLNQFASCVVGAVFAPSASGSSVVGNIDLGTVQANGTLDIEVTGQVLALNASSVAISSSVDPSIYGGKVTLTATVSSGANTGSFSGQVTFNDGGQALGSPVTVSASGSATYATSTLAVGTHQITASYSGDQVHTANTSPALTQTVNEATQTALTVSANPAQLHTPVTLTAVVSPKAGTVTPSGQVTFYDGSNALGTATLDGTGTASLVVSSFTAGTHSLTAAYGGVSAQFLLGSTSAAVSLDVQAQSSTSLATSSNPSTYGNALGLTAMVMVDGSAATSGSVQFKDGTTVIGTAVVSNGVASYAAKGLTAGQHMLTATYGSYVTAASSVSPTVTQTVQQATTASVVSWTPSPAIAGKATTLTATVSLTDGTGTPTGSVTFTDGGATLGTAPLSGTGQASLQAGLTAGGHSIVATYGGDANNSGSASAAAAVQVNQATTAVALVTSANPSVATSTLTLTATVSGNGGTPGGVVTFTANGSTLGTGTLDASGKASVSVATLAVGSYTLGASYGGDTNDLPSSSAAVTETIGAIASTTTLGTAASANGGSNLILVATVVSATNSVATGAVTFVSGSTVLGSAPLNATGVATLTPSLNSGVYQVVAQYAGDAVHAPSSSAALAVTEQGVGFNIVVPAQVTVATSQNTTFAITLESTDGFADVVGLGCAGLPAMMTCHFSAVAPNLTANGQATVQLTIDTNAPLSGGTSGGASTGANARLASANSSREALAGMCLPGAALLGLLAWRGRKRHGALLGAVLVAGATLMGMGGCAGLSTNSVSPGTYTVQVTGAGQQSAVTRAANLTIEVTH